MRVVLILALTVVLLFPLVWMFSGSLQDIRGILRMPPQFPPQRVSLDNYRALLGSAPLVGWIANSLCVMAATIGFNLFSCLTAGYAFSVYRFPAKEALWWALLASLMLPRLVMVIPAYVVVSRLGLVDTLGGAVLPLLCYPVGVVMCRYYIDSIPRSIFDAARLDGASEARILTRLLAPLSAPALAVVTVLQSVGVLGDYLWQTLVLVSEEKKTLLVGLMQRVMSRPSGTETTINPIGASLAAGVLLFIPTFLIFCLTSRYFTEGLKTGGVKE